MISVGSGLLSGTSNGSCVNDVRIMVRSNIAILKRTWCLLLFLLVGAQLVVYRFTRDFIQNRVVYSVSKERNCTVADQFVSWEKGVVTQLGAPLNRDCHNLGTNATAEINRVNLTAQVKLWKSTRPWESFALKFRTGNCSEIREEFSNLFYVSEMEKEFPIAYILVVYTNPGQVLRFLKSIYRPHNLYCIHPDARQGQKFSVYFKDVERCMDNVFVVSKPVKVYYGDISILDAQLHCMQDLMKYPATSWKYVINLSGREIPLKTNREIVESLKELNNFSAIHLVDMTKQLQKKRFTFIYNVTRSGNIYRTSKLLPPTPPRGIKIYKSSTYLGVSRDFVHFLLNDPLSIEFHKYLNGVHSAEEHYYASLYVLPQAQGGRPPVGGDRAIPIVSRAMWVPPDSNCPGHQLVHHVCISTSPDYTVVERLRSNRGPPIFFFNKYFLELDPIPMDCAEEQLVKTNMEEYWQDCVALGNNTSDGIAT